MVIALLRAANVALDHATPNTFVLTITTRLENGLALLLRTPLGEAAGAVALNTGEREFQ